MKKLNSKIAIGLILIHSIYANIGKAQENGLVSPFNITYPVDIEYLKVPDRSVNHDFRVEEGGKLAELIDGKWIVNENNALTKAINTVAPGDGVFILGAPAIIRKLSSIDVSSISQNSINPQGHLPVCGAVIGNVLTFVRSKRIKIKDDYIPEFTIYKYNNGFVKQNEFRLKENPYNLSLGGIWPLDSNMAAIVLSANRDKYVNMLIIYDIQKQKIVGCREFGEIIFNAYDHSLTIVDSIPNSSNIKEALDAFRKRSSIYSIRSNIQIPEGLSDLNQIISIP